jgi:hypothetical protein
MEDKDGRFRSASPDLSLDALAVGGLEEQGSSVLNPGRTSWGVEAGRCWQWRWSYSERLRDVSTSLLLICCLRFEVTNVIRLMTWVVIPFVFSFLLP